MTDPIRSTDLALLHHLQAAEAGQQLPKNVAHELEQQGLAEADGPSPGEVRLTAAGRERLQVLAQTDSQAGDVLP
jgi:hypothetical protein